MASENAHQHPQIPTQEEDEITEDLRNDDSSATGIIAQPLVEHTTENGTKSPSLSSEPSDEAQRAALFAEDDGTASEASIPSDDASEQVTSPSVSVPPYWSHPHTLPHGQLQPNAHGHNRVVSSASAESVLPPGAITLQDNEREDGDGNEYHGRRSNSSEVSGRDRNRACWARSVQVTDYVLVNGSTTNIGAFVVWHIRVETLNVRTPYVQFYERSSMELTSARART